MLPTTGLRTMLACETSEHEIAETGIQGTDHREKGAVLQSVGAKRPAIAIVAASNYICIRP